MHKEEKSFVKEKKEKLAASPVEKVTNKQKNIANSSTTTQSPSEYMIEYRAQKKPCKILLMSILRDRNAFETILMTAQINTDFVNHPVSLTTEPSTSLVRVGTDTCKSIINSIFRYRDYDSHKNAHKDFQKRFIDNPFGHGRSIYDRLWFRDDLRTPVAEHKNIL
ncbi:uncharacterized protein TNCV_2691351 [Trichonephila clavipes]|uniref:Uncharacterized protein n=1 Tax=Trichonephila clavipes TaxID=2585209 RepID=A0A8X6VYU8_TRICX|nr:uncharacterized protein TNCV_2691351 [Trichonephila clavipes]